MPRERGGAPRTPDLVTTMKTRAAVFHRPHESLGIETLDVRSPGPHEVLVEFKATGLCHTDLSVVDGALPWAAPTVLGHEGAGVVVETGPMVTYVAPGDHVIGHSMPQCGHCAYCASERTNLCDELLNGNVMLRSGFASGGVPVHAYMGLGTFANFAVLNEDQIAKVNPDAPLDKVCTIGCALVTGVGSALCSAEVQPGSTALVIGLGAIGLSVVQGARLAGASRIIAVDTNDAKEAPARLLGATEFVNPKRIGADLVKHLVDMTGGGADYAFECVGSTALMETTLACTRPGLGVCCLVGIAPADANLKVDPMALLMGRRLISNSAGNTKVRRDVPRIVDWYMDGKIMLDPLISHVMPFDRINDGFEMMRAGKVIRPVFLF
ncbi:MAG: zinc-binding dehydrogenase [Gammaproteobacteria bacterium]